MSETNEERRDGSLLGRKGWVRQVIIGGLAGATGYFIGRLLFHSGLLGPIEPALFVWIESAGPSGIAGLVIAAILLLLGLYLGGLTLMPDRLFARAVGAEPDEPNRRMRRMLRIAAAGLIGYVVLIAVFLWPNLDPEAGLVIGVIAFAAVTALFVLGMRVSDELERAAQNEAMAWSFIIVEAAAVGWALLHNAGYAGPIDPLAAVLLVTLIYCVAGTVAAVRRGIAD